MTKHPLNNLLEKDDELVGIEHHPKPYYTPSTFIRNQRMTIVYGILTMVLILVILQIWLITATMNSFLGGEETILIPSALISFICLGVNYGLLRYLYGLEKH